MKHTWLERTSDVRGYYGIWSAPKWHGAAMPTGWQRAVSACNDADRLDWWLNRRYERGETYREIWIGIMIRILKDLRIVP